MEASTDAIRPLGTLALGSRLRRISDRIMADGSLIYRSRDLDFEPRWFPLYRLLLERDRVAVGEAAAALGVSQPAVTQIAHQMVKRGVVTSHRDAQDGRLRRLSLTGEGRALEGELTGLWHHLQIAVDGLVEDAGEDPMAALQRLEDAFAVKSLAERFEEVSEAQREEVVVEEYRPADRQAFRRLNLDWVEKLFAVEETDLQYLDDPEAAILEPGGAIFMARLRRRSGGEETIGTCALVDHGDGVYELAKMAVTDKAQGRGIGTRLGQAVIDRARALGGRTLFLETNSRLGPAIRVYRKLGFRHAEPRADSPYERADTYMVLDLELGHHPSGSGAPGSRTPTGAVRPPSGS